MTETRSEALVQRMIGLTEDDIARVGELARQSGIGAWSVQARVLIREALDSRDGKAPEAA